MKKKERLSFSVSREEAVAIKNTLLYAADRLDAPVRGVCIHFASKVERALARKELLGKEG